MIINFTVYLSIKPHVHRGYLVFNDVGLFYKYPFLSFRCDRLKIEKKNNEITIQISFLLKFMVDFAFQLFQIICRCLALARLEK